MRGSKGKPLSLVLISSTTCKKRRGLNPLLFYYSFIFFFWNSSLNCAVVPRITTFTLFCNTTIGFKSKIYLKITFTIFSFTLLITLYPESDAVAVPPSATLQYPLTLHVPSSLTESTPSIPTASHSGLSAL